MRSGLARTAPVWRRSCHGSRASLQTLVEAARSGARTAAAQGRGRREVSCAR
jgi:hypothetical protein